MHTYFEFQRWRWSITPQVGYIILWILEKNFFQWSPNLPCFRNLANCLTNMFLNLLLSSGGGISTSIRSVLQSLDVSFSRLTNADILQEEVKRNWHRFLRLGLPSTNWPSLLAVRLMADGYTSSTHPTFLFLTSRFNICTTVELNLQVAVVWLHQVQVQQDDFCKSLWMSNPLLIDWIVGQNIIGTAFYRSMIRNITFTCLLCLNSTSQVGIVIFQTFQFWSRCNLLIVRNKQWLLFPRWCKVQGTCPVVFTGLCWLSTFCNVVCKRLQLFPFSWVGSIKMIS